MNAHPTRHRAFTLIELMVVVAIISVLASIAVPNFQDAQVRSKVSRTVADMRSLTTAIETYRIDENEYPYRRHTEEAEAYPVPERWTRLQQLKAITTPIAYMTFLPRDVFEQNIPAPNNVIDFYDPRQTAWMLNWNKGFFEEYYVSPDDAGWILVSVGPDGYLGDQTFGGRSNGGWPVAPTELLYSTYFVPYDPTNGTVSTGNIFTGQIGGVDQTGPKLFNFAIRHILDRQ